jgi:hypothetical protein
MLSIRAEIRVWNAHVETKVKMRAKFNLIRSFAKIASYDSSIVGFTYKTHYFYVQWKPSFSLHFKPAIDQSEVIEMYLGTDYTWEDLELLCYHMVELYHVKTVKTDLYQVLGGNI